MSKDNKTNWDKMRWTSFEQAMYPANALPHWIEDREKKDRKLFLNSIYQVEMQEIQCPPPFGRTIYLSFKTKDKQPRHDWREMQRIKNELVGAEVEAMELYPSEERLVDTSNQYHLYCFPELDFPGRVFPFGFKDRMVVEGSDPGVGQGGKGSRQRDFRPEFRPSDVIRGEVVQSIVRDPNVGIGGRCPTDGSPLLYKGEFLMNNSESGKEVRAHRAECLQGKHICFFMKKEDVESQEEPPLENV